MAIPTLDTANASLPAGYALWADQDGDWWLDCPDDVTLFSLPGEALLIGECDIATALADAQAAIRDTE